MTNKNLITIKTTTSELTHIAGVIGDYATICGLAGEEILTTFYDPINDEEKDDDIEFLLNHGGMITKPTGSKVTCEQCIMIWKKCGVISKSLIDKLF